MSRFDSSLGARRRETHTGEIRSVLTARRDPRLTVLDCSAGLIDDGRTRETLMPDKLHPNAKGMALLAESATGAVFGMNLPGNESELGGMRATHDRACLRYRARPLRRAASGVVRASAQRQAETSANPIAANTRVSPCLRCPGLRSVCS